MCVFVCESVGYAWLPLLKDGRLTSQEFNVPVSCTLPSGYLLIKEPSSNKVREREVSCKYTVECRVPFMRFDSHVNPLCSYKTLPFIRYKSSSMVYQSKQCAAVQKNQMNSGVKHVWSVE